jgi:hypothetical protein
MVDPNGITSIPNYIQIRPAVLELNHMDRQTDGKTDRRGQPHMRSLRAHRPKKRIITNYAPNSTEQSPS